MTTKMRRWRFRSFDVSFCDGFKMYFSTKKVLLFDYCFWEIRDLSTFSPNKRCSCELPEIAYFRISDIPFATLTLEPYDKKKNIR